MRANSNRGNCDEVDMRTLMVNGEFVEEVDNFNYLGATIYSDRNSKLDNLEQFIWLMGDMFAIHF